MLNNSIEKVINVLVDYSHPTITAIHTVEEGIDMLILHFELSESLIELNATNEELFQVALFVATSTYDMRVA